MNCLDSSTVSALHAARGTTHLGGISEYSIDGILEYSIGGISEYSLYTSNSFRGHLRI